MPGSTVAAGRKPGILRYWALIASGEPYRLLFLAGILLGLLGVGLWPAWVWGATDTYPGPVHARIMIQGFLGCLVVGFLGTAYPRLLEVRRFSIEESLSWTVALVAASACHLAGITPWGDFLFTLSFALLLGSLLTRFRNRRDMPPPGFVLVPAGLLCAVLGGSGQLALRFFPDALSPFAAALSKLLLYQGFLLLPVMGIGAFLIPRYFDLPNRQHFPESPLPPEGWMPRALFAIACGVLALGSFAVEAAGNPRLAYLTRALAVIVYLQREVPAYRAGFGGGAMAMAMRLSLVSIPLGYLLIAAWPERQPAFIHVVFISGFSLLALTVASRVMLGHGGHSQLFRARLPSVYLLAGLLVLAMATRVSADWMPAIRNSHLAYAACAWLAGVAVWGAHFVPLLFEADEE